MKNGLFCLTLSVKGPFWIVLCYACKNALIQFIPFLFHLQVIITKEYDGVFYVRHREYLVKYIHFKYTSSIKYWDTDTSYCPFQIDLFRWKRIVRLMAQAQIPDTLIDA